MKHKRLAAAVLAAAVVLAGCGSAAAPAAPAGSGTAAQSTADTAVQTAQKDRITEQFTLEKTIQLYEWGSAQKLTIHVPQLVCDGPDAAYLNDEFAAMYGQNSDSTRTARRSSRSRTSGARRFISTGTPTGTATA